MELHPMLAAGADELRGVAERIEPADFASPTPCAEFDVRALLNHVIWATRILSLAGRKEPFPTDVDWSEDQMTGDWRARLSDGLSETAKAWSEPAAWTGTTVIAGGSEFPATFAGELAFVELILHGWDLARAAGLPYDCGSATADAALAVMGRLAEQGRASGSFGPEIAVHDSASSFDRVLGLSGRDPQWAA
ncbi:MULTISPECIES: TIGR03086 family metal-binding protein [Actinoalloteichus]|uniref:TIGR03086 family protein n=1 Tax=Actinoalloteichus fjordicus TaxID=1612552 RepID=A0AAC9LI51_9PSEU|nr:MULTISPECIES: TIGR03086 family metal-binding protein [Actinoalloteichus]APU16795.1 putative TIGR03086 family protein [Actinoalloteichus fjordicus]APU22860.1 putative TIGR03086 family protein [Actinoalloteichus sp. GBA129-24]